MPETPEWLDAVARPSRPEMEPESVHVTKTQARSLMDAMAKLEAIEGLAGEAARSTRAKRALHPEIPRAHWKTCYLTHAGCLAEKILEEAKWPKN